MHDTPPPTKFGDGSFNAELKDELSSHPAGGGRWHHRCVPTGAEAPFLAHLKVLKGNGEELVFEEHAEEAVITIELASDDPRKEDAGNLRITGGPDYFQIDSDSKLKDPQPGSKGRQKYEHPGKGKSFHISRILVENPLGTVKLDEHAPDHEEEYVIMVWHKGDDHGPRGTVI